MPPVITANKTSSRFIISRLTGFQKRSCRTRGGLTSSPPRNEVESGTQIDARVQRRLLPELKLDTQYFSIGDIGGVDTWFHCHAGPRRRGVALRSVVTSARDLRASTPQTIVRT